MRRILFATLLAFGGGAELSSQEDVLDQLRRAIAEGRVADVVAPTQHRLLKALEEGQRVEGKRKGESSRSLWSLLVAAWREAKPELRREFERLPEEPAAGPDEAGLLRAWRRSPWTKGGREALRRYAERMQEEGQVALADRALADLAVGPLEGKVASVPREPASKPVAPLEIRELGVPVAPAWNGGVFGENSDPGLTSHLPVPYVNVQQAGPYLLVVAPRLLACFDPARPKHPSWWRKGDGQWDPERHTGPNLGLALEMAPAPLRAAVGPGRAYVRWGLHEAFPPRVASDDVKQGRSPITSMLRWSLSDVAAFDLESGDMVWSTSGTLGPSDLRPACDPVLDSGRIYYLARGAKPGNLVFTLVCLRASDGSLVWARKIADGREFYGENRDATSYGNGIAIADAAIYFTTGAGLLGRCDARDGMVEWIYEYDSLPAGDFETVVRREGAPPVLVGNRVVFVVRDRSGVFALDRETGAPAWAEPAVPSHSVVAAASGAIVLRDAKALIAIRGSDGKSVWRRTFDAPFQAQPESGSESVVVGSDGAFERIGVRSGITLEKKSTPMRLASRAFGVSGPVLAWVGDRQPGDPVPRAFWRGATPRLSRAGPRLLLADEGTLTAIDPKASVAIWKRFLAPTFREAVGVGARILLVHEDRLVMLGEADGRTIWELRESVAQAWSMEGLVLVQGDAGHVQLHDAADGTRRWRLASWAAGRIVAVQAGAAGLHILSWNATRKGSVEIRRCTVRARDGTIADDSSLGPVAENQFLRSYSDGGLVWICGREALHRIDMERGTVSTLDGLGGATVRRDGDLILVEQSDRNSARVTALKPQDSAFRKTFPSPRDFAGARRALTQGGSIYVFSDTEVQIYEAATGKAVRTFRPPSDGSVALNPIFAQEAGGKLHILSATAAGPRSKTAAVRSLVLDVFDLASGAQTGRRSLPGLHPAEWHLASTGQTWRSDAFWTDSRLYLTGREGLRVVSLEDMAAARTIHQADRTITLDGDLSEWRDLECGAFGSEGQPRLWVSQDGAHLLIAASHPASRRRALWGNGRFGGGGSWLEIEAKTPRPPEVDSRDAYGWRVGCDAYGHAVVRGQHPQGARAATRFDLLGLSTNYEVALPLQSIRAAGGLTIAVSLWDEALGGTPVKEWGELTLKLSPYSRPEEAAGLAIAAAFPDLPESRTFVRRALEARLEDRDFVEGLLGRGGGFTALVRSELEARLRRTPWVHFQARPPAGAAPLADARTLLRDQIPRLGRTEAAVEFFGALVRKAGLDAGEQLAAHIDFVKRTPNHPQGSVVLGRLWDLLKKAKGAGALEAMEAILENAQVSYPTAYEFRRRTLYPESRPVGSWHAVGPFPVDRRDGTDLPPQLLAITLKERFPLAEGERVWTPWPAGSGRIDLGKVLGLPAEAGLAYAVTWVESDIAQEVRLELQTEGAFRIWVNRQELSGTLASLARGWNMILLEITATPSGTGSFRLELIDRYGRGPVRGLKEFSLVR